jgi:hypothetical protein
MQEADSATSTSIRQTGTHTNAAAVGPIQTQLGSRKEALMNRNKTSAAPERVISFKIDIDNPRLSLSWALMNHPPMKAATTNSRHLPERLLAG